MGRGFMKGGLPAYGRIDVPDFTKCVVDENTDIYYNILRNLVSHT